MILVNLSVDSFGGFFVSVWFDCFAGDHGIHTVLGQSSFWLFDWWDVLTFH